MRVPREEFRGLDLEVHAILNDVPLHDVTAIDLPGGGTGRTISDVRALVAREKLTANPVVRALFAVRLFVGRLLGWDSETQASRGTAYLQRLSSDVKRRSLVTPGSPDGAFRLLYVLERESLAEIRNATVHAFLASVLAERPSGYRLYWAVYVKPVSRLTPLYMALIEPFRRFVVYPSVFRRIRAAWEDRYALAPPEDRAHPG